MLLLLYIYVILVKLFFVKDYKNYPPFVPSFGKIKKLEFIKISKQLEESRKSLTVLDPGCGTADLIIKLAKKFPKHKFVGIEWNKSLYNIAKLKSKNLSNFTVLNQNMFDCSSEPVQRDKATNLAQLLYENAYAVFPRRKRKFPCFNRRTVC